MMKKIMKEGIQLRPEINWDKGKRMMMSVGKGCFLFVLVQKYEKLVFHTMVRPNV